jgi:hypothetical protein
MIAAAYAPANGRGTSSFVLMLGKRCPLDKNAYAVEAPLDHPACLNMARGYQCY